MTDAPNSSSYILVSSDLSDLPNSRVLEAGGGLILEDTGVGPLPAGVIKIVPAPGGNLAALSAYSASTPGFIAYDASSGFVPRGFTTDSTITITNPTGQTGDSMFSVNNSTTVQNVNVQAGGVGTGSAASVIDFVGSGSVSVTALYSGGINTVTIDAASGADTNAKYIIQTADSGLPNAQNIGLLSTGVVKVNVTSGTGVLADAVPYVSGSTTSTDYMAPSAILGSINTVSTANGILLQGNGSGGFNALVPGDPGTFVMSNGVGNPLTYGTAAGTYVITVLSTGTTSQVLATNNTYIPTATSLVTFTFPPSPTPGDFYVIQGGGFSSVGWTLSQTGSQTIQVGYADGSSLQTTPGSDGSLASVLPTDSVFIYCITATEFIANVQSGQITVT
jgi:hypothetical protein